MILKRPAWQSAVRLGLLGLVLTWSLFPIGLVVMASVKPAVTIFEVPPRLTFHPTLANYVELYRRWPEFFGTLRNSLLITLGATGLTVIVSSAAGYVYSRFRSRALTASAFFMVGIRMFPPIVITLPLFPAANMLGLMDTHLLLILLYATFFVSLCTWVMRAFIDQIPREMEEAASVDGASLTQTLVRVTLPLAAPGMIASAVFVFVFSWNEFLFAFIFTTTRAKTAPLILSEMLGAVTGVDWGAVFAAATIQLVPILIFVLLVQRHLIIGLTAGSIKE